MVRENHLTLCMQEEKYNFLTDQVELKFCLCTADTGYPALSDCTPRVVTFGHIHSMMRPSPREIEVGGSLQEG